MFALHPDRVVIRTEATQVCYTIVNRVRSYTPPRIIGHGGVGIVEAIGENVRRVQVGDRVMVANTPHSGQCYTCLRGRGDGCQMLPGAGNPMLPIGTLPDNVEVVQHNNEGGFGELMIPYEWYCMPIFGDINPVELSMMGCVGACGLGTVFGVAPVDPGSDVAVLGAGPVGLSAIQGARIKGASQIISIEPIPERRELALKLGATTVLDPNVEGMNLVARVRDLCKGPTDRRFAGGRNPVNTANAAGPDFVIEAVGGDAMTARIPGPDPTGLLPLQQAWDMCSSAGHVTTCSVGHRRQLHGTGGAVVERRQEPPSGQHERCPGAARSSALRAPDPDRAVQRARDGDGHLSARPHDGRGAGGGRAHHRRRSRRLQLGASMSLSAPSTAGPQPSTSSSA
jgi:S-(hydroxymethyl)glutathione dehydrogenase/alcohol dehydrogenase